MIKEHGLPLNNRAILVTRARSQASELAGKIEELGGEVIELPVIQMVPPTNSEPMERAIRSIGDFDWILLTSTNGVAFFGAKMREQGFEYADIQAKLGVVGPKTGELLKEWGRQPDLMAKDYKAEGLLQALEEILLPGDRVLIPRANIARPILPQKLKDWGVHVTEVDAYDTILATENVQEVVSFLQCKKIDIITFTSSSTVKNFLNLLKDYPIKELLMGVKIACIGPITAKTAEELGLQVDITAEEYTIDGLMNSIIQLCSS